MNEAPVPPAAEASEDAQRDVKDLARGGLVTFVGKLGRVARGAFIWIVTLLYGLDVQGFYTMAWGIVATLNNIGRFGLQRGVVRYVVEGRAAGDEERVEGAIATALVIALLFSAAVSALAYLSAGWIETFYEKPIAASIRIMAWSAPFMAVAWVFVSAIRALRIMRYEVYVMSIAGPLFLLVGALVVSLWDTSLEAVAWVQLGMAAASFALSGWYFARFFSLGRCLRRMGRGASWKPMLNFSFPVMVTDLLYSVLTQLDVLMLGFFVSGELVGIFALARRIASSMLKAPQAFDPIFSSIVSELSYRRRFDQLGARFAVISRWILTINLPIFACLLIVGDQVLALLGGERMLTMADAEIAAGLKALFLLCVGMMVQGAYAAAEPLLAMSGRPYLNLLNNVLWLLTNFLLNIWLIDAYGILGAALGAAASMLGVNALRLAQIYLLYQIQPFHRSQLKPLAAALCAALAGWLVSSLIPSVPGSLAAALLVFVAVYFLLLYLLGMEVEDRVLLARLRQKVRGRWRRDDNTLPPGPARGEEAG